MGFSAIHLKWLGTSGLYFENQNKKCQFSTLNSVQQTFTEAKISAQCCTSQWGFEDKLCTVNFRHLSDSVFKLISILF